MSLFRSQADRLGWQINEKKVFGPSQTLSILGMQYNTIKQVVTIDDQRREKLLKEIHELNSIQSCRAKRIESLVGKLTYISQTITGGLCHIYPLRVAIMKKEHYHFVNLHNRQIKDCFEWWTVALTELGDLSFDFICYPTITPHIIHTDASTSTGAGGWFYNMYFQYQWPNVNWNNATINFLEIYAVLLALLIWKNNLVNQKVILVVDNEAVSYILNKQSCRNERIRRVLSIICDIARTHCICFTSRWIDTMENKVADVLSR